MEAAWKIAALCLVGAALVSVLKQNSGALAFLLGVAVAFVALSLIGDALGTVTDFLCRFFSLSGLSETLFTPLLKTVAIALVSRLSGELCRDAGEGALATAVEIAAAFSAVVVSLPLFAAVWELLQEML